MTHASTQTQPHIVGVTPWVGQPSNVWMYRQFRKLDDQLRTIVTWEYLNQSQFPLPNTDVRIAPDEFARPLRGIHRMVDSLVNPRVGGSRFGNGFTRWFQNQLVDCQADAVLGQFGHYAMVAEVACRRLGLPVFAHFHGFDLSARLRRKRYRQSLQSHWHDFAGMIVVARYQQDYLLSQGVDPDAVALIPCGAPSREISAHIDALRSGMQRDEREFKLLFVGRFTEKKDPLSVLKAFAKCRMQHSHVRLRMAGGGPLEGECREWISQQAEPIAESIELMGSLSPDQVMEEMAAADAFVQHSRVAPSGDKEGWPVVIGEAMSASLPILSTRHAGIRDQVDEGQNGFLCDEGDWQQMGQDMIRLVQDPGLHRSMAEASLAKALQYDSDDQIEKLRQFMNQRIVAWNQRSVRRAA